MNIDERTVPPPRSMDVACLPAPVRLLAHGVSLICLAMAFLVCICALQAEEPAGERSDATTSDGPRITVRMVSADAPDKLVSDLESLTPVTAADSFSPRRDVNDEPEVLGERAVLWVRGASINETFGFERYYQERFIARSSQLSILSEELGCGEHVIQPGNHRFTLAEDGRIGSNDQDISIDGDTVTLKVYGIDIMAVRDQEIGPVDQRLEAEAFGVYLPPSDADLTGPKLPDPSDPEAGMLNLLSHARRFYPLRVYLPANTEGVGYMLYPYGQTFRIHPGGRIELTGSLLPGIDVDGTAIVIRHAVFQGRIESQTGLGAGVGANAVAAQTIVRPSRRPMLFTAGFQRPSETFGLPIDPDFTSRPRKFFVADNLGSNLLDVRLLALEWDGEVLMSGETTTVSLRFLENHLELRQADLAAPAKEDTSPTAAHLGRDLILGALHAHDVNTAPAAHPFSILRRMFARVAPARALVWSKGEAYAPSDMDEMLSAMNLAMHDPVFYSPEGFAGIELSAASREAVERGIETLSAAEQLLANRDLLYDLFPGAFIPFTRPPSISRPAIRAQWSKYYANLPVKRVWESFAINAWDPHDGTLTFSIPELAPDFYYFRFMIVDEASEDVAPTGLYAEILFGVLVAGQTGSASFVSQKGRDAFQVGETVRLEAVIRSADEQRAAGNPAIVLIHPDGRRERIQFQDSGGAWAVQPLLLDGETTLQLPPGAYELTFDDLPGTIAPWPFSFTLVGRERESAYTIIKPSKYTKTMNGLIGGWYGSYPASSASDVFDLDRAVRSLSEMGYNRIELMTYTSDLSRRVFTEREQVASRDARLPAPASVYQPSPRNRILNAAVRHQMEVTDVVLTANDHHLPRYIESYTQAAIRLIQRETAAMRHSPAFDGLFLYDEMYSWGLMNVPPMHTILWPGIREQAAEAHMGERPADIRNRWSRELRRPRAERDREALERFLALRRFELGGWGDFNSRLANAAREVEPRARISTYNSTFFFMAGGLGSVASGIDMDCGFRPDVFRDLDIRGSVHYLDGPLGSFLHSPMQVQVLRFAPRVPVWINVTLHPSEYITRGDGQYQRRMTFGMLAEGADGISLSGLDHSFADAPNPSMLTGRETIAHLNREVLVPFGELVTETEPGYRKVGIVLTFNQLALSDFKHNDIRTPNQIEEIWLACWRLGYPAVFLREDAFETPIEGFDVIFVPGIRFDGELDDQIMRRLTDAMADGTRVVVERNSTLGLEGVERVQFDFNNYFLGSAYMPSSMEDELYRVYRYSQPAVDFLAGLLPQWTQPSASGPFTVGPNWRSGGDMHYLVMGNYENVDLSISVKQYMAQPSLIPLTVSPERGSVAYDLLHGKALPLEPVEGGNRFMVDMTRIQGALIAFLPEAVERISSTVERSEDGRRVRLSANLAGASGNTIAGPFPARITLSSDDVETQRWYRVLGGERAIELDLPGYESERDWRIEIREGITGKTVSHNLKRSAVTAKALRTVPLNRAFVPYPDEVRRFWDENEEVLLVVGQRTEGMEAIADTLAATLESRGIRVIRLDERDAFRYPTPNLDLPDPYSDGFHTWRGVTSLPPIPPTTIVDYPVVLLASADGSHLLHAMVAHGYFSLPPVGGNGLTVQPTVQLAHRALHYRHDTLSLIANDPESMRHAVAAALGESFEAPPPAIVEVPLPRYTRTQSADGDAITETPAPSERVGNNEMITALELDAAGNLYVTTWGHGDNLYSLDAAGNVRFSHFVADFGPFMSGVYDDHLLAHSVSGARLFKVGLDGKPIWQMQLPMDPAPGHERRPYWPVFQYHPRTSTIVYRDDMNHAMRIIDKNGNLTAHWQGEDYEDPSGDVGSLQRGLHGFAISPDGTRLAQFESRRYLMSSTTAINHAQDAYLVVRDMQGRKIAEWPEILDHGVRLSTRVQWLSGDPGPSVTVNGHILRFDAGLTRLVDSRPVPSASGLFGLGRHGALERVDARTLQWIDGEGRVISRIARFDIMPSVAAISDDAKTLFFLDEYGQGILVDAATGARKQNFHVPERGHVARFTRDGTGLLVGGLRGSVMRYDLDGHLLWRTWLGEHNRILAGLPLPERAVGFPETPPPYNPAFIDHTDKQWPPIEDQPGQLDEIVLLDPNRLINGDAVGETGWQPEGVVRYASPGFDGSRSIRVGDAMITQQISGFIGDHFTWVLEFRYRRAPDSETGRLTAGLQAHSRHPSVVVRHFDADDTWRYARVVAKSGKDAQSLTVGFRDTHGATLVDAISLRRIRFPSVNHLLHEPIHDVRPRILTSPLLADAYDPLGRLRDEIPNRIIIENLVTGGMNLIESAFLQNAWINDVGSDWYTESLQGHTTSIALGLREPTWVSMAGIYFNAYDEENITPHYDIYVADVNTRQTHRVASVRNNRQLFHLSKFEPRLADQVIIKLINAIPRRRTVTEIELYGPLSGKGGVAGFVDPAGQNTYMGDFTRVDPRPPLVVGQDFDPLVDVGRDSFPIWNYPVTQPLLGQHRLHLGRALGFAQSYSLIENAAHGSARANSLGFGNAGALYGGIWLLPGNDGVLYGVDPMSSRMLWSEEKDGHGDPVVVLRADPGSSRTLWSAPLGERLGSGPVAIGNDVFAASDTGRLYVLDLGSGALLRDAELSGGVVGSLATDGKSLVFISEDGFLQCWDAASLKQRWTVPVATWTESTPAISRGIVYVADRLGVARAIRLKDGHELWKTDLGEEFMRCPVVTDTSIYLGFRRGKLVALNRADGAVFWETRLNTRFSYEPFPLTVAFHEAERSERIWSGGFSTMKELPGDFETLFCPDPTADGPVVIPAGAGAVSLVDGGLHLNGRSGPEDAVGQVIWRLRKPVGDDVRVSATVTNIVGSVMITLGGDALNGYRVVLNMHNRVVSLDTVAGGTWRELARARQELDAKDSQYRVRAEKIGAVLKVAINDEPFIEFTDPDPLSGPAHRMVSLGTFTDMAHVTDLEIERIDSPARAWEQSVLLVFEGRTAMLVDVSDGTLREWSETKTIELPNVPLASISRYQDDLYITVRSMNAEHGGLVYAETFHQWVTGGAIRLRMRNR